MARIRSMKPEMFQDEKLAPLDVLTRFVFLGLIGMADDAGRMLDNVRVIDAFIFPETDDSSREALATLSRMGRIRRGVTASGQRIIEICNWSKHQKIDHPNIKGSLPEIVEEQEVADVREPLANDSRNARETFATRSVPVPVPVPTTNDQGPLGNAAAADVPVGKSPRVRPPRPPRAVPAFAGFPKALCDAVYEKWLEKAGAVDYGRLRKAFGPMLAQPESERPTGLPRDAEVVPAVAQYLACALGTSEARFRTPERCAERLGTVVHEMRQHPDDPEARLRGCMWALGISELRAG